MTPRYVFIGGTGRTGTTLLIRCLNRSPEISIQGEIHFMGGLLRSGLQQDITKFGELTDDSVVRKVVDFIYSRPYRGGSYWRWVLKNVDKEDFTRKILDSDRSPKTLYSMLMELSAQEKQVVGEKTTGNIFHLPTLIEWFPNAKFIHSFRDPRAVFVSETKNRITQQKNNLFPHKQIAQLGLKKAVLPLYVVFRTTILWSRVVKLHNQYEKDYPENYCLSKFEDLVHEPEKELRRLCCFLGVEFKEEMLEQVVINTGFKSEMGKSGFNENAVDRWKAHINPLANAWFLFLWKQQLKEFGYLV
ncbi:MAG: sulfotransferase [Anaerolineae bacterium]|nr:sulfotransferase [Anaerolineae bacterium]